VEDLLPWPALEGVPPGSVRRSLEVFGPLGGRVAL